MITIPIRKSLSWALVFLIVLACQVSPVGFHSLADTRPAEDRGAMALGQAIKRLGIVGSVLHTGAHPDDEDSGMLAYLARGRQARTAYLSLTRGDGGQNVIGPELYESLGVLRTEELLAARRIDGAQQFFTRAFDFGFSKSRTETLSKWDREGVLADMVRVIRTFRPMVIVSAWSGTPNDGHGHHQSAGLLSQEAYRAASDPSRFPEQIREGLRPWQAKKLYLRSFDGAAGNREFLPSMATLSLNTGEFDPLLGCSYYELAARGRSQHRSQDQGTIEARGPRYSRLRLIDSKIGAIKNEKDIFEDIDTSLVGIAAYAGASAPKLRDGLAEVQAAANEAKAKYSPLAKNSVSEVIARGLRQLRAIRSALVGLGLNDSDLYETEFLLNQKEADFADALLKSEGVVVDCLADDEVVTPGQNLTITLTAYANSDAKLSGFSLRTPKGWTVLQKGKEKVTEVDGRLVLQIDYAVTVAADAEVTEPYWLKNPRSGDMFVPGSGGTGIEPSAPPVVRAEVAFDIAGQKVETSQQAESRYADRTVGEVRRELKVAPAVSVEISPGILVVPQGNAPVYRVLAVSITSNSKDPENGSIHLDTPQGIEPVDSQSLNGRPFEVTFALKHKGERQIHQLTVRIRAETFDGRRPIRAIATIGGKEYRSGNQVLSYSHIQPRYVYQEARTDAEIIDVKVAPGLKVGFIEGAGDDFAAALTGIGVTVKTIDEKELASADLSVYDAIVAGVRVYEVRPDVIANNARLMEYVNRGGTYIVQYSRGNFETGGYAPYRTGREDRQDTRTQGQRGREPRLLYLSEAEIASALSKSAIKPRVGFIGAAGDKVLESLRNAGLDAKPLEAADLRGDLSQLDVIVVGSDASKRSDLAQFNSTLLEYSRRKLVIAVYSQLQFARGDFPSYPKPDARPFRVTDELAPVTILEPDHPRFNFPNKITERDFEGWVQERGAYFLGDWDSHFKPLLACHDPGEPDLKGGEVIAEYGKGLYVYTAYAWFRQLPKGVPGAYRLIANLVSLSKSTAARGQKAR